MGLQFTVNETAEGVVAPPKTVCKVKDCPNGRFTKKRGATAFCKKHSGLKNQMSRAKFKELAGNSELVIAPEKSTKKKGITSKKKLLRLLRKQLLTA